MSDLPRVVGFNPPPNGWGSKPGLDKSPSAWREHLPELIIQFDDGTYTHVKTSRITIEELRRAVQAKDGKLRRTPFDTQPKAETRFSNEMPAMTRFDREIDI